MSAPGRSGNSKRQSCSCATSGAPAADHVAHVQLRELVVGEVDRRDSRARRASRRARRRPRASSVAMPTKMCASRAAAQPVVELGDDAAADGGAELAERARALGDRHAEAAPRALRRPRRVRRRSAGDRSSCWRRSGRRRGAAPVVPVRSTQARRPATASAPAGSRIERVSSKTSLIAAQISSFETRTISSTVCADDRKRQLADLAHRDAVGEDADVIERDAPAGGERLVHRVGLERLDADDPDRPAAAP